jgi:HD-GYP domain-containing protein (c-di-GMP phosphodiesterase class II)
VREVHFPQPRGGGLELQLGRALPVGRKAAEKAQLSVRAASCREENVYQNISVNLLNLVLSLSDALDLASPELSQHQLRTAFVAWELGKAARLSPTHMENLFIAAALHDIGALSPEQKIDIHRADVLDTERHCILGEALLKEAPIFEPCSKIVRFHHKRWEDWEEAIEIPVVLQSQILLLADALERSINRQRYILHQSQEIISAIGSLAGTLVHPDVLDMLRSISPREDFWLDLVSPRLYSLLLHNGPCRKMQLDVPDLTIVSELFRDMIDFRSPFTATHSSGVAACASAISRLFGLTENETELMEVAGNLHDLGKMAVPSSVLDKPGKLTREEFALMRQHTYFTYTVLNTVGGIRNIAEWAAFHHEKLDGSGYPFHIDGTKLNVGARILAVADNFTALTEDRPYRKGMTESQVVAILRDMRERNFLDANVLNVLNRNYDEIAALTATRQAKVREYYEQQYAPEMRASAAEHSTPSTSW